VKSFARHGFDRFFFVNGHGGNRPPVRCEVRNWWQIKSVIAIADEVFGDAVRGGADLLRLPRGRRKGEEKQTDPETRPPRPHLRRRGLPPPFPRRAHRLRPEPGDRRDRRTAARSRGRRIERRLPGFPGRDLSRPCSRCPWLRTFIACQD
ncbi:MAG TPA: hypothetical protein EYM71_03980, partial [Rhodospirillales bacterium]|nr:hypothetical protein [Rhodospirillales bacterium]